MGKDRFSKKVIKLLMNTLAQRKFMNAIGMTQIIGN